MPGNEFGDRVHNFFAQDNAFQGQPESQVVEGNWPVLSNNNFWIGNQRQADTLHSNSKTYNLQDPDIDRGQDRYPFHVTQGLNFAQSNVRSDFSKSQSLNEQPNLNGYMFGNQFHLSRQNTANFLAVDSDYEPHHATTSRGFSVHELQQGSGMENGAKTSLRSETSVPSVSLDLFGGQQQMSHHQSSILQPVQHQHPGINNMQQQQQQQQQQLMIRKMQDLQRQQQFQPLEIRQQNHSNQVPAFTKQASGSHSTPIDGNPVSDLQQYPWITEVGTNWMNRGSPSMQGPQTELVFPPNLGQTQHLVDLVPQPVDQSLYGVPVSGSRGLNVNQYSHKVIDRSPILQMSTPSSTLQGNHNFSADQVGVNDEDSIARQKFQNENMIGHTSSQSLYTGPRNMNSLQQVNPIQRNAPQDLLGRQELTIRPKTPSEKSRRPVVTSSDEVALDPAEEKILFGSDDNIFAAFGNAANMSGESGNLFDNGETLNGLPSIHSGSWSALMQSAVAETSSNDMVPQEEWSGLIFHNVNGSSANQSSSVHNTNFKRQSSLVDDKTRMPSAPSPGSIPPSGDSNANNVTGLNLLGHMFLNEPGQRLPNEVSERFVSLGEANKWSNYIPPQKSVAEDSQIYRDASQHSPEAGMSAMKISSPWAHQQSGSQQQSNGRNTLVAIPTRGDRGLNAHQAEKLSQNSKSNQLRGLIQGEAVGGSLWKSNSVSRSGSELCPSKPTIGNPEANKVTLSLNDAAPVANPYSAGVADETNPFFHNSHTINQWKNSNSSTIYQGGKDLGRMPHQAIEQNQGLDSFSCEKEEVTRPEMENYDMKENSNDSHRSNLSGHTSGGFRETGSGASDSKSLPPANQKSTNQLFRKVSVPRKFQYHPMGNSDEDAEPSYHLKQSTNLQAMSQPNSHLDQSNFLVQHPRNSKVNEKWQSSEIQKHNQVTNEEPPHGGLPGYAPSMSVSYSLPFDSFTPSTVSSSGQNMLELLPKVDQSRGHGDMMHLSSGVRVSAQLPEAEKVDGTAGFFQQNQSYVYQGFGLQLGPPSLQQGQIPDHSASRKAQNTVNSMPIGHVAAEMGEKGQRVAPTSTIQSLNFPNGDFQAEFKNIRPAVPQRHTGSDERHRKFQEAISSGSPHVSQLQNQQVMRSSGKIMMNQHVDSSFSGDVSNNMQRGSMEMVFPDIPEDIQKVNVMSSRGMTQQAGSNDVHERGPTSTASARDPFPTSQHYSMHGISHQGSPLNALHDLTTNVYTNQHSLGTQYQKASSQFSDLTQPNTWESSSAPLTQGNMNTRKGGDLPSDLRSIYVNSPGVVDGEEQRLKESAGKSLSSIRIDPSNNNFSDNSPANLSSTQKNIEAFGRSLKHNSFSHQNHASLNQIKTLKDAGDDPSCRVSKRMKGPDNCLDVDRVASTAGQPNDYSLVLEDSLGSSAGVTSDDLRRPSFLLEADALQINPSQHGNVAPQDILSHGTNVSHSNSSTDYTTSIRAEYPEVSPQMAPSWFNQYGTFKNGQMLHSYNAHMISSKSGELGKSPSVMDTPGSEEKGNDAPTDACQINTTHQTTTSTFVKNAPLLSGRSYELNATDQNLMRSRPKKRKTATSQLQPWHKEIADGSQNLLTLSVAETAWSQMVNRLNEKADDDAELIEDGPLFLRSKRRLILTTQLMQQLVYPPPAAILSADASFTCESVAYAVSRTLLGNVCSAVFRSSSLDLPRDGVELLSAKGKSSERNVDRYSGIVMEGLMGRLGKLENDFLRLEKSSSIFDVRMECQDLEKFSVINRLAKFHGRGQTDVSDTAPSHKSLPQRYVSAIPMPRSLPDRVQCLSL